MKLSNIAMTTAAALSMAGILGLAYAADSTGTSSTGTSGTMNHNATGTTSHSTSGTSTTGTSTQNQSGSMDQNTSGTQNNASSSTSATDTASQTGDTMNRDTATSGTSNPQRGYNERVARADRN